MPQYEFICIRCGEPFTRVLPVADRNSYQECHCGGMARRQVTAASFTVGGYNAKNGYAGGGK